MFDPYERPKKKGQEEAKQELARMLETKRLTKPTLTIQTAFRCYEARSTLINAARSKASTKVSDLKRLKSILGNKLSVLPVKSLVELIRSCSMGKADDLIYKLRKWVDASLKNEGDNNLMNHLEYWNYTVKLGFSLGRTYCSNQKAVTYLISLFSARGFQVPCFDLFLLYKDLEYSLNILEVSKKHLETYILLASDNKLNSSIKNLLDFVFVPCFLFYRVCDEDLAPPQKEMVFNQFVETQAYLVESILSIPRISKFLLQNHLASELRWKDLIQSYYYTKVANAPSGSIGNQVYLFGNLWELFSTKLFATMQPNEMFPLLMTCALCAQNLSPKLLETDPSASIAEPINLKTLRKQITIFTDPGKLTQVFLKVLDHNSCGFSDSFDPNAAQALCKIYHTFYENCQTSKEAQVAVTGIMGGIAFNSKIIYRIWKFIEGFCDLSMFLDSSSYADRNSEFNRWVSVFGLFCCAYQNLLMIVDDQEFPKVFDTNELVFFMDLMLKYVHETLLCEYLTPEAENLMNSACRLLNLLHEFNSKKHFVEEERFQLRIDIVDQLLKDLYSENTQLVKRIIQKFPFCFPFATRVDVLYYFVSQIKEDYQFAPRTRITVRRQNLVEDSINQLLKVPDIKGKLEVRFIDVFGNPEEGIDAGGLFKEFWTSLSSEIFNPDYGLFSVTEDQCLYPNPDSELFFGKEHLAMFYLVGRVLGKAISEKITVEPQFAEFFLRRIVGKSNFLEDLKSLDKEVYQNLKFLKSYQGDASDLCLTFTARKQDGTEIELVSKGSETVVTNQNKLRYIYKLVDYRLNLQIKSQINSFFKGLSELIPISWLKMFTPSEMQIITSGTQESIDINDLKANTRYIDCGPHDGFVRNFWKCLESFSTQERSLLVRFVTSCPRPPLFGFKNLNPPFTISKVRIGRSDTLPTSQTCVNLLRLPDYSSARTMKQKLLYSINAGAGFDFQ